jgi:hypothetical protein
MEELIEVSLGWEPKYISNNRNYSAYKKEREIWE